MIGPQEKDDLRRLADRIRCAGQDTGYGYFPGGDPREFSPDPECSTDDEREAHRVACAKWDNGECEDAGPPCAFENVDITSRDGMRHQGLALVHRAGFGLGTYTVEDEEVVGLAQQLDDWLDAVEQNVFLSIVVDAD